MAHYGPPPILVITMAIELVSLDEFKAYKKITKDEDDPKLLLILRAASQLAKTYCRRTFVDYVDTDKVEYFDGDTDEILFLSEFPIISITSVEVSADGATYTTITQDTDYFIDYTLDAIRTADNLSFTVGSLPSFKSVKVTYKGGYTEVPEDLKLAVMDLAEYYRQEEYTPRKSFQSSTIENIGFRAGGKSSLPAHIKRVFEMYKAG